MIREEFKKIEEQKQKFTDLGPSMEEQMKLSKIIPIPREDMVKNKKEIENTYMRDILAAKKVLGLITTHVDNDKIPYIAALSSG
ncbi:MAG: hypothetical protein AB1391_03935 [Candidatus Micrarchaeota archaeon]